jgi:uncharacterized protein (DUF1800 family)
MAHNNNNNLKPPSRRHFLKASAAVGVAGVASLSLTSSNSAQATAPVFNSVQPLKPGPEVISGLAPNPPMAALVLNKAGFGPRPGDIGAFNALGVDDVSRLTTWVDEQLNPTIADPEVDARIAPFIAPGMAYDTINKTAAQLWSEHAEFDGNNSYLVTNRPRWQMERLCVLRAVYSKWQLRELMNDFWFNHFNVQGNRDKVRSLLPNYDQQIRSRVFGNFYEMLEANSKTASMLYYLDNYRNSWPNPNENYAREVLELHTLGAIENYYGTVDPNTIGNNSKGERAGYSEIDVFQFARALTGWSVADGTGGALNTGEFFFRADKHYDEHASEAINVMDMSLGTDGGEADVTDILRYLADHYGTARFIAWKLCTRLVGDNPPESLVSSTADEFYNRSNDSDQLKEVTRHILMSNEFQTTWGAKVKRPLENIVAAMRATDMDINFRDDHSPSDSIFYRLGDTGQSPYDNETPTGFPDEKALWSGSGPLVSSWRTITYFLNRSASTYDDPDTGINGGLRYFNLAEQANAEITNSTNRTPTQLVDMWVMKLRGYTYDATTRSRLISYVEDKSGVGSTQPLLNTDDITEYSNYQRITHTLVGLILMAPDAIRR